MAFSSGKTPRKSRGSALYQLENRYRDSTLGLQNRVVTAGGHLVFQPSRLVARHCALIEGCGAGEKHAETGDASKIAAISSAGNAAVVLTNDALADPQPQACAFGRFGAEERLEKLAHVFGPNAFSCVEDGDERATQVPCPVSGFANVDSEHAAIGHSLKMLQPRKIEEEPWHSATLRLPKSIW